MGCWRIVANKGVGARGDCLGLLVAATCLLENEMSLGTILLIVVVLLLIGAIPTWPHSRSWGYAPSGGIGLVLLILIVLLLLGRI